MICVLVNIVHLFCTSVESLINTSHILIYMAINDNLTPFKATHELDFSSGINKVVLAQESQSSTQQSQISVPKEQIKENYSNNSYADLALLSFCSAIIIYKCVYSASQMYTNLIKPKHQD